MDFIDLSNDQLNASYVDDYYKGGMFEHLALPGLFCELMKKRHWIFMTFYLNGITDLENWYGDKAERQYADWFEILDNALKSASDIFWGSWIPFGNGSADIKVNNVSLPIKGQAFYKEVDGDDQS